ncbi:uncharacterized protein LOC114470700 [Gouania willdenowi]|uniref:uncharacterized protein LOC114470700 n=1 Tax=Gouania willdenowi TaxID=441366 RepID=UPI001054283F|nr:uncharacterized protein LOC114470700 [Gouania willdenowi]
MGVFSMKRRVNPLQQRWMELRDREHRAHQYNQQLLHQFAEAQDTLRELQARNAEMKLIRMEYERYLQENGLRWQQQLQTAQRKRMETYSNPYPHIAAEEIKTSPLHDFSKRHSDDDYVSSLHRLTNNQSHSADLTSSLQPDHPQRPYSMSNQNTSWSSDPHWSRISTSLSKKLYTEEPQVVDEEEKGEDESSRGGSSERQRRSSSLGLDVHPGRGKNNNINQT